MRRYVAASCVTLLILGLGCVIRTEHRIDARVQVDIRYIEERADDVLDFIEGQRDTLGDLSQRPPIVDPAWYVQAARFLSPIQTAHAQELKTDSARAKELATRMRARFDEIEALKKQGCFGEDNRGYLELFDCGALDTAEKKNAAQKLKAAENDDRKALYNEFAKLNADANVTVAQIERIFARRRLDRAKAGEMFQLPPAGSDFDAFKNSAAGTTLGSQCQPGAWVTIP